MGAIYIGKTPKNFGKRGGPDKKGNCLLDATSKGKFCRERGDKKRKKVQGVNRGGGGRGGVNAETGRSEKTTEFTKKE